jgi:N-carbamoyl-L-amino-acid hydrolase
VAREALTPTDLAARRWLAARYATRPGYAVGIDAAANLHIRRLGQYDALPFVMTGSHPDTQPLGGWLDGAFGVMAGLEVLDALDDAQLQTHRSLEVVAWTNEEGSRFAPGIMGSQAYAQPQALAGFLPVRDAQGISFEQAQGEAVRDFEHAAHEGGWHRFAPALAQPVFAYVEAHIEQGPILEREGLALGIVQAIQGVRWYQVTVPGRSAHAGTTPLADRDDAQAKAIALAHALLSDAANAGDEALRVTIGRWACQPDSVNTIANRVVFTIDVRHPDAAALDAFDQRLRALAPAGTGIALLQDRPTTPFDPDLVNLLDTAAARRGLAARRMVSGAFHDAMPMAAHAPTAMLFAPSIAGISHHPDEHTHAADLAACTQVLADGLLALAQTE